MRMDSGSQDCMLLSRGASVASYSVAHENHSVSCLPWRKASVFGLKTTRKQSALRWKGGCRLRNTCRVIEGAFWHNVGVIVKSGCITWKQTFTKILDENQIHVLESRSSHITSFLLRPVKTITDCRDSLAQVACLFFLSFFCLLIGWLYDNGWTGASHTRLLGSTMALCAPMCLPCPNHFSFLAEVQNPFWRLRDPLK